MKRTFISIFLFLSFCSAKAQKHDQHWLLGYYGSGTPPFRERLIFNFNPTLTLDSIQTKMNFEESNAAISNSGGRLLFFTNGNYIADATGDTMFNGDDLNHGACSTAYSPYGIPLPQSEIILPSPGDTNIYYIFHMTCDMQSTPAGLPQKLMYTVVDMTLNGGLGGVTQKNVPIFFDQLVYGQMTSCKHGNGSDWWIFVPKYNSNAFHRILLNSSGITSDTIQYGLIHGGQPHPGGAVFSPDGEWYSRYDANTGLSLMRFDRCNGLLSDELIRDPSNFLMSNLMEGGVAFSQSSQFLYTTTDLETNQFDVYASDIMNSQIQVAIYDTFNCPFGSNMAWPTLAPDGKIYITASSGNYCISYIEQPDLPGLACNVVKHGITLPMAISRSATFPNNPNFRLGSKDCTSGLQDFSLRSLDIFPNPASSFFSFNENILPVLKSIQIYSVEGKLMIQVDYPENNLINTDEFPDGIYTITLITEKKVFNGQLIIMK